MREKTGALSAIIKEYKLSHTRRNRLISLILVLSIFVVSGVSWQLRLTGVSMTSEAYCGLTEHVHTDECKEEMWVCELQQGEGEIYPVDELTWQTGADYHRVLACGKPEHSHCEECYQTETTLICTLGHEHTEDCYETATALICEDTSEDHTHTDDCYETTVTLVCGLDHTHGDECYSTEEVCICGLENHVHTEDCYKIIYDNAQGQQIDAVDGYRDVYKCGFDPEYYHIHTLQCYSNPAADVETAADWERIAANVELTGVWADDLIAMANTQLGYKESKLNYLVQEDGTTLHGITRYGQWYGAPYDPWCAMFISWCLSYAGISEEQIPYKSSCKGWIDAFSEMGVYYPKEEYTPVAGDLIFFDLDKENGDEGFSDHVGIVYATSLDDATAELIVSTIEGNKDNMVNTWSYGANSDDILGYCCLDAAYQLTLVQEELPIEPTPTLIARVYDDDSYTTPIENGDEIIVLGQIPENAVIKAYPVEVEIEDCQVICAYDISIFLEDGTVYEPETPLTVQIKAAQLKAEGADRPTATVYFVAESGEAEQLASQTTNEGVVFSADHFSVYAVTLSEISYEASYNPTTNALSSFTLTLNSSSKDYRYVLQYSDGGSSWNAPDGIKAVDGGNGTPISITYNADNKNPLLDPSNADGSANRSFRLYGTGKKQSDPIYISPAVSFADILDSISAGFAAWLGYEYVNQDYYGNNAPSTLTELYNAFALYNTVPTLSAQRILVNSTLVGVSAVLEAGATSTESDEYRWQYLDEDTQAWLEFDTADVPYGTTQNPMPEAMADVIDAGGKIRCVLYRKLNPNATTVMPYATSNEVSAEISALEIDAATQAINTGLGLATYAVGNNKTADLSIGGTRFNNRFYYGNVARDSRVPFSDAQTYAAYLAATYINNGNSLSAVQAVWDKYLYDLYDPSFDKGIMDNVNTYPNNTTYGDEGFDWPKDASSSASSPFHANVTPEILQLNYNYLDDGIDYSNFITGLNKTATGVAAGDANADRLYDIKLKADVQAKVNAPVVLILQIQTSWQMFDLAHANITKSMPNYGKTAVGAAADNSRIANLYDIKQALLGLADYMAEHYTGNNLVIGITDVEHAGTYSMFNGANSLYVTNNPVAIKEGLYGWDTFGNCEHVHYTSDALETAVANLQANLAGWQDIYGYTPDYYDDIRKVGVIIGGTTEADGSPGNDAKGWACQLPWSVFGDASLNAVYGIKTNEGIPYSGHEASWLDYSGNNGTAYGMLLDQYGEPILVSDKTGKLHISYGGNGFTKKYDAPTEGDILDALIEIVETEMRAQGIDIFNPEASVDNYEISDKVQKEFEIDYSTPFTLTVTNSVPSHAGAQLSKGDYVQVPTVLNIDMTEAVLSTNSLGEKVRTLSGITYTVPLVQGNATVTGQLVVTEHGDNTATVTFGIDRAFNNSNVELKFRVQAREDYIGSNNVFTNVGKPNAQYQHIAADNTRETYPVRCNDTPRVNVPIRFSVVDGETTSIFVGDTVDIATLSTAIVEDAEFRAERYPQICGTLTYSWALPGGGTKTESVTIENGEITTNNGEFPDFACLFTGMEPGGFPGTLTVTFAPNNSETSQLGVNPLSLSGVVQINVIDDSSLLKFFVEKQWLMGDGGNTTIDFNLLCNGQPICDDVTGQPIVYTLNATNHWRRLFENMPAAVGEGADKEIAVYTVEEINIPEGYIPSYLNSTETVTAYGTELTYFTFTVNDKNKDELKDKAVTVEFTSAVGGYKCSHTFTVVGKPSSATFSGYISIMQPLGADGEALDYAITKVTYKNANGIGRDSEIACQSSSVTTIKSPSGEEIVDKLVISNAPAAVLPETGGIGTMLCMLGALISGAAVMTIYVFKRKYGEGRHKKRAT